MSTRTKGQNEQRTNEQPPRKQLLDNPVPLNLRLTLFPSLVFLLAQIVLQSSTENLANTRPPDKFHRENSAFEIDEA